MAINSNCAINQPDFIVCQIGAREHYAIPRALHQEKRLAHLITDSWVSPQSILHFFPKSLLAKLRERFHQQLISVSISEFKNSLIGFELKQKIKGKSSWETIIERNQWFQEKSIKNLEKIVPQLNLQITVFAYSYAALEIFKFAKKQGWQTVLGQIDPGIYEEQLVKQECALYPQYKPNWQPAPTQYWKNWQQECQLADRIIVNSHWSKKALQKVDIQSDKIEIIPLAYELPTLANNFRRLYPSNFSQKRPLRVLFLGQVILRKGVGKIFEAIELLSDLPVEFWFVGSIAIDIPQSLKNNQKVKLFGSVSRSTTTDYYKQADVFLFPTLSDGFGLTQLEAQAWQLPIIASQNCGAIVKNKFNGLVLSEVTAQEIANSILFCLNNPNLLQQFSQNSFHQLNNFSLSQIGKKL